FPPFPPSPLPPYNLRMIRIAATADMHMGTDAAGTLAPSLAAIRDEADLLLLGGDLTRVGDPAEAEVLVGELRDVGVPVVAVLGNHDYHSERAPAVVAVLRQAGIRVLDRSSVVLDIAGQKVAIAGTKGFGGGFGPALADDFGEPEMRAWIGHAEAEAEALAGVLGTLVGDVRLVLLHYAPVPETLTGERLELYPFLGNSLLGEAIDRAGADLVLHGHAHRGTLIGATPGGVPVRNVAQPVIRRPYVVFTIEHGDEIPARGRRNPRRPRWLRRERRGADPAA
ncbi:MAG: metallophosphoesterase, partial [Thermomicrobiales bacterium]